ncbi:septal ring lytic transglycosylase RlpA family protein [Aquibium sp. LZ166]|uniref:Endolytic peptidoglycan transglycosylase RlpA n=1 Tax=Aquibium pacificus TaxID=3153579 RepID=A0ABV3SJJ0_9HYPH
MQRRTTGRVFRATSLICVATAGVLLASCASQPTPKAKLAKSKEYFAESEYGVKASPRLTSKDALLPRGGGRDQLGKAYKVKGKWYKPKEDPNYVKVGRASWYGDAFHGRLTANGEIYDMTHLTAAHPTMPLPSYARVTNTKNGNSVIVRVNDRGPFANDRIIDLSKRAADLLDYTHSGVAQVKVEYVGRAPLHGQDDRFLMASYRPGGADPVPGGVIATGVMIAMNGPTPTAPVQTTTVAFAGSLGTLSAQPTLAQPVVATGNPLLAGVDPTDPSLPSIGPAVPERPAYGGDLPVTVASLSYAEERISRAGEPFSVFAAGMTPAQIVASWERGQGTVAAAGQEYLAIGTYSDRAEADAMALQLSKFGRPEIVAEPSDGEVWYTVNLHADGREPLDRMLTLAWSFGATDAMPVRD